ncbi:hypothetical protein [Pseudomonas phage D6]|nr:hypothetical protein [Pseudomonas phage D6]
MSLWQRIKAWFASFFGIKKKEPLVFDQQKVGRSQRSTPIRSAGESEVRDSYRLPPSRQRTAATSRMSVSSTPSAPTYTRREDSLLDTVVTALAIDNVVDMVSDAVRSEPEPSRAGWGDHEARVASENAYSTARAEAARPSEPVSSTRFDDTRSSSFDNSSSTSYDDSSSRSSSSSSSSTSWGGDSSSSSSSSSWGDSGSSSWSD